jgi:hypothetical protein
MIFGFGKGYRRHSRAASQPSLQMQKAVPPTNSVERPIRAVPEKWVHFSDILDIGYIRCLIKDML